MNKRDIRNEILDAIAELNKDKDTGSLLLHVDTNDNIVLACTKGNMESLAKAFMVQMDSNQAFNRVMMSLFGSYLSGNPEQKETFLRGLEISDQISLN